MIDQIYDRDYQAGRAALNEGIGAMVSGLARLLARKPAARGHRRPAGLA